MAQGHHVTPGLSSENEVLFSGFHLSPGCYPLPSSTAGGDDYTCFRLLQPPALRQPLTQSLLGWLSDNYGFFWVLLPGAGGSFLAPEQW